MELFVVFFRVFIEVFLCVCKLFLICNLFVVFCGYGIDVFCVVFLYYWFLFCCSFSFSFDCFLFFVMFVNKVLGIGSGYFNLLWFRRYEICLDWSF